MHTCSVFLLSFSHPPASLSLRVTARSDPLKGPLGSDLSGNPSRTPALLLQLAHSRSTTYACVHVWQRPISMWARLWIKNASGGHYVVLTTPLNEIYERGCHLLVLLVDGEVAGEGGERELQAAPVGHAVVARELCHGKSKSIKSTSRERGGIKPGYRQWGTFFYLR